MALGFTFKDYSLRRSPKLKENQHTIWATKVSFTCYVIGLT